MRQCRLLVTLQLMLVVEGALKLAGEQLSQHCPYSPLRIQELANPPPLQLLSHAHSLLAID